MQLCFTLFGVVSGLLYFQEYHGMTQLQTAMFVLGVAVVCLGAGALARASQGGSGAAVRHLHADQETAKHNTGLKPMPDSFFRDVHQAAPAGSTDFRLHVAWQQGTGLARDSTVTSNKGEQGTSGCWEAAVALSLRSNTAVQECLSHWLTYSTWHAVINFVGGSGAVESGI
jgi:hypothetical protein